MPDILIVDDDFELRAMLRDALETAGHHVREAADGEAGLAAFQEQRPDIVLSDLIMPEKEGLETIMDMHRIAPEIPIVAMSGTRILDTGKYLRMAERFGAAATFTKPFKVGELLVKIDELLAPPNG